MKAKGLIAAARYASVAGPRWSNQEARTAERIASALRALGLEVRTDVGGHGVVGVLRGSSPGPVVAYRADMDAVIGDEPAGREYGSRVPGVFHAHAPVQR